MGTLLFSLSEFGVCFLCVMCQFTYHCHSRTVTCVLSVFFPAICFSFPSSESIAVASAPFLKTSSGLGIVVGVIAAVFCLLLVGFFIAYRMRRKKKGFQPSKKAPEDFELRRPKKVASLRDAGVISPDGLAEESGEDIGGTADEESNEEEGSGAESESSAEE